MIRPHSLDPLLLDHAEEEMAAEHDLDLVESVRWHGHAYHVAERVRERTRLHFEVQPVCHLYESLDSN